MVQPAAECGPSFLMTLPLAPLLRAISLEVPCTMSSESQSVENPTPTRQRPVGARANQVELQTRIQKYIVNNGYAAGAPLAPEATLMEEFGVSRHPLREAMKALEALGIVDIRHGYGTFVGSGTFAALEIGLRFRTALSAKSDFSDMRDLMEIRETLEIGLTRRLITSESDVDLKALEDAVRRMEVAAEGGHVDVDADWTFHRTLYEPLNNAVLLELLAVFFKVFVELEPVIPMGTRSPTEVAGWHRRIFNAVRARDAVGLAEAMDRHFDGLRARITELYS